MSTSDLGCAKGIPQSSKTSLAQAKAFSWRWLAASLCCGCLLALLGDRYRWSKLLSRSHERPLQRLLCNHPFPIPTELSVADPSVLAVLERQLQGRASDERIDSLSVAIVTSSGSLFEWNHGVVKANETSPGQQGKTDRNTIYRLISLSKLITTVQTWILSDRGLLSWTDEVSKYIHELDNDDNRPMTIQEVASHLAGIPSNMPPGPMPGWPYSLEGAGEPPDNGLPFPTRESLLQAINSHSLTVPPGSYPVYSNTGFSILGMVNVAADGGSENHDALVQRDIFGPLGMSSSGYHISQLGKSKVAIPSNAPHEADWDFLDAMNPSGGCFSTLADLIKLMQGLLSQDPNHRLLSGHSMRSWMRPLYPWYDDVTEQGILWEIRKYRNTWGQTQRLYEKYGQSEGYHTALSINPSLNYGVIVLSTGSYFDTLNLTMEVIQTVQPSFDLFVQATMRHLYEGRWLSTDPDGKGSEIVLSIAGGSMWAEKVVLNGSDILRLVQRKNKTERVPVWSTGRPEEFRFAFGLPSENDQSGHGCLLYSFGMDIGYAKGAPINQMTFSGDDADRTLFVPSVGDKLRRA
ncbi:beta-lactamase/transpeptidase-like protein [Heliocybe sulcata]|uniref:Beta-lactamase/transpeptidase-like protein n=1 Tax=Heliocybe sulcata TaxID=5364 RepID=A0A5C3N9G2_9AGAM|nr:beta-lactamase/transpeptidase-like protein [Heliocybe sulcata]